MAPISSRTELKMAIKTTHNQKSIKVISNIVEWLIQLTNTFMNGRHTIGKRIPQVANYHCSREPNTPILAQTTILGREFCLSTLVTGFGFPVPSAWEWPSHFQPLLGLREAGQLTDKK